MRPFMNAFKKGLDWPANWLYSVFEHVHILTRWRVVMYVLSCYFSYLAISIALTVWVARTLHKNGRVFLVDAFNGNAELADSVNHQLVVGFYLINIGYIALGLKTTEALADFREVIELESVKLGVVLLVLGGMHFFNVLVFAKMRRRGSMTPRPALS